MRGAHTATRLNIPRQLPDERVSTHVGSAGPRLPAGSHELLSSERCRRRRARPAGSMSQRPLEGKSWQGLTPGKGRHRRTTLLLRARRCLGAANRVPWREGVAPSRARRRPQPASSLAPRAACPDASACSLGSPETRRRRGLCQAGPRSTRRGGATGGPRCTPGPRSTRRGAAVHARPQVHVSGGPRGGRGARPAPAATSHVG